MSRPRPSPSPSPRPSSSPAPNPTSPTSPLAPYPPLPAPEHRSRAPEFYGFAVWSTTYVLFALYVLWALLPDAWIRRAGVAWYPNREWALLVPAWTTVAVLLTYFTHLALALRNTPAFSDLRTLTDSKALFPDPLPPGPSPYHPYALPDAIPEAFDIPIGLVNRVLYHRPRAPHAPRAAPTDPNHDPDIDPEPDLAPSPSPSPNPAALDPIVTPAPARPRHRARAPPATP